MSDEPDTATTSRVGGLYIHYCREPGFFGFAAGKGEPQWYCFEHRPTVWPPVRQAV